MPLRHRISRRYRMTRMQSVGSGLRDLLNDPAGMLPWARPKLRLDLVSKYEDVARLPFEFDVGADLMLIPTYVARHEGIAYSQRHRGNLSSSIGGRLPCFYDFVTVRSSLSGRLHRWPCAFAESTQAPLLVGRAGFLDDFLVSISKGHFIVSYAAPLLRGLSYRFAQLCAWLAKDRRREEWTSI
jgi:hypothetical protein